MDKTYTRDEVYESSLKYFDGDELAANVFADKYALRDNNNQYVEKDPNDLHRRLAKEFARIEKKKFKNPLTEEEIYNLFDHFKYIIPQGSPMFGIGNKYQYVSSSNCFVIESPSDSYSGIMEADQQLVQISKRRGGTGLDISNLRPIGSPTKNAASTSTGIIPFMERFSNSIREVGQNGRRGANMLTLSVHHPEILSFITVKSDLKKVTGSNISVKLTNEFLKAVENNEKYEIRFPVDYKEKGIEPQISKMIDANEIWNKIIEQAREYAEPGILFWDNIIEESPADCYADEGYKSESTNPCCFSCKSLVFVITNNGVKEIKQIDKNDLIWVDTEKKWAKTSGYFSVGKHEVKKVTLSNNSSFIVTNNHKVLTPDGLKKISELKVYDAIETSKNIADISYGPQGTKEEGYEYGKKITVFMDYKEIQEELNFSKKSKKYIHGIICGFLEKHSTISCHGYGDRAIYIDFNDKFILRYFSSVLNAYGIRSVIKETLYSCQMEITERESLSRFLEIFIDIYKNQELNANYKDDVHVAKIENFGIEEVGCIEVEDYHMFTANGIISGNSEIPMCGYDSCRLMVVNIFSCVENPFTDKAYFNYDRLKEISFLTQRLMEDMIDLEAENLDRILKKIKSDPESDEIKECEKRLWENIKKKCIEGRRTGTGITALGDTIAALGIKYGSEESIDISGKIFKTIKHACYRSSVEMAKELGPFKIYNWEKEKDCKFIQRIKEEDPDLYDDMKKYGRRNIALLTMSPSGSISIISQTTSGIEPLFQMSYKRRKKIHSLNEDAVISYVDDLGDSWQEYVVVHPKIKMWMDITGETDIEKSPWFNCCAEDIDWVNRVKLQSALQKHNDHSISSCLSADNSFIQTDKGLLDIKEFEFGEKKEFLKIAEKIKTTNHYGEETNIAETFNNGEEETIRIAMSNGSVIQATKNHKLYVLGEDYNLEWKKIKDIDYKDIIVGFKNLLMFPQNNEINIGDNPFLYEFAGMAMTSYINKNEINLLVKKQLKEEIVSCLKEKFLIKESEIEYNISPSDYFFDDLNLTIKSQGLCEFLTKYGIGNDSKSVPYFVRTAKKENVISFLNGLFCNKNKNKLFWSDERLLINQLQYILNNFGVETNIIFNETLCLNICDSISNAKFNKIFDVEDKEYNENKIRIFEKFAPDYGIRKRFRETFLSKIKSNIVFEKMERLTRKELDDYPISIELLREMKEIGFDIPETIASDIYTLNNIISINYIKEKVQTYDLSVPNGKSYIVNGIISHNTINLPEDVSVEKVKEIYETAWRQKCKGATVYRKNCRSGVLIDNKKEKKEDTNIITKTNAPKRPKELRCEVYHPTFKYQRYYVAVGLLNDDPYEVFTGINHSPSDGEIIIPKSVRNGTIIKETRGKYILSTIDGNNKVNTYSLTNGHTDDIADGLTRMISVSLRHGVDISFIVHQLEKTKGDIQSFSKVVARTLKKYIPDGTKVAGEMCPKCEQETLERSDGCVICKNCGWTKC